MNVLSLFDGISCGQLALKRARVKVHKYYASEIDEDAMAVTMKHFPKTTQLGDVTKIKGMNLPRIDLLIGGSPCQGFSASGKKLNFNDPRSKLFFEFVRLRKELKPKYFFLENVVMPKRWEIIISKYLGVSAIKLNSSLASAQNRNRLYWTNIPFSKFEDRGIVFGDVFEGVDNRKEVSEKLYRVRRLNNGMYQGGSRTNIKGSQTNTLATLNSKTSCITTSNTPRFLYGGVRYNCSVLEMERLQTLPDNYVSSIIKTKTGANKAIGNAWTVDVIVQFFKNLKS